jgi:hypothetical protein
MKSVAVIAMALLGLFTSACSDEKRRDVSTDAKFEGLVGMEYEVIGPIDAYGIRQHSGAPVEYVTLMPPPGIAGSYVGFRVPLQPGSTVVVQRVYDTNRWPDPDMSYDVVLKGTALPTGAPVRIDLFRGNEGEDRSRLNPRHYRRVSPAG